MMMRSIPGRWAAFSLFGLALAGITGCETAPAPAPATPATSDGAPSTAPSNDIKSMPVEAPKKEAAAGEKLTDEEIAEIKKLPADEQMIAMNQKVCPVSGGHLGSMKEPIKQVVEGKTFFLCCKGCEGDVKADPAAVLAKLPK